MKKSHTLLIGSLLIFVGIMSLTWNYFVRMKDEIYSDMKIAMMDVKVPNNSDTVVSDAPVANNVNSNKPNTNTQNYTIDYSKYLGVLEIPRIGLKKGFYNVGSKYNDIQYNVMMVPGSNLPDVVNGNLILMAHSGDAYISYFAFLYKLNVGDPVYVTYNGRKYKYQIVSIYQVPKIGALNIRRNRNKTSLTMVTCTKDNDKKQTVYLSELVG